MLENVWRKGKISTLLVRMWIVAAAVENCMEISQKTKNGITTWSSNPTPGHIYRQNSRRYMHSYIYGSIIYNSQDKGTI